ncbi:MAG: type II toxin-antitoxin system VapC family toxin [Chloroflexota bacterium]|nr:type II toxin-antitoxin system VapC family toxin [Chloroflexota bacterium]
MASDLLVDTDVCIDHLRGARPLHSVAGLISYSVITRSELFAGRTNEARVEEFLAPFREIPVDRMIAERAGRLRRGSAMRTPDALIAATAIEHGLELVTRNRRDFEAVPGLQLRDPMSLNP